MKVGIGEKYSQRNTGETASCSQIHHLCTGLEVNHLGDAQGMQHVMFIKIGYVLARNDIDLAVPVCIKIIEGSKLCLLRIGQVRKIFQYNIHIFFFVSVLFFQ